MKLHFISIRVCLNTYLVRYRKITFVHVRQADYITLLSTHCKIIEKHLGVFVEHVRANLHCQLRLVVTYKRKSYKLTGTHN